MRFFLLSLLSMMFVCSAALAEDLPTRGNLPKGDKVDIFKSTPEQIEEALQITAQCQSGDYLSTYYDCDCLGMKFLELRQLRGNDPTQTSLLIEAEKSCPNAADTAGETYNQCLVWSQAMRPKDYQEFCACFASEFAKQYEKKTTDNSRVREAQLTRAFSTCDKGKMLNERLERESILQQLRKKGIYALLFPGAAKTED